MKNIVSQGFNSEILDVIDIIKCNTLKCFFFHFSCINHFAMFESFEETNTATIFFSIFWSRFHVLFVTISHSISTYLYNNFLNYFNIERLVWVRVMENT